MTLKSNAVPFPPQEGRQLDEMKSAVQRAQALLREQEERLIRLESLLPDKVEAPSCPRGPRPCEPERGRGLVVGQGGICTLPRIDPERNSSPRLGLARP